MYKIGCWNIWGLNSPQKQKIIRDWGLKNMLGIIGLLETKVVSANMEAVITKLQLPTWKFVSNVTASSSGRVMVGWDPTIFRISCLHSSDQWMTCDVIALATNTAFKITFVYGLNTPAGRELLWNYMKHQAPIFSSSPWIILGDFNAILKSSNRIGGDTSWYGHHDAFGKCIQDSELIEIPHTGMNFTWHNGQQGDNAIMKKLDWVFSNHSFLSTWPTAHSRFLPRDYSDHSSMLLEFSTPEPRPPSPFKFLNFWAEKSEFLDLVRIAWQTQISGNPMFRLTTKLRIVKHSLRSLHKRESSHISSRVAVIKSQWQSAQLDLDGSPDSTEFLAKERLLAGKHNQLCKDEEAFYKQRSRIQWLQLGDRNTKFFHRSLVHRTTRNRIHMLMDEQGNRVNNQEELGQLAVKHFQNMFKPPLHVMKMLIGYTHQLSPPT